MLTRNGVDAINRAIDATLDAQTARHLAALAEKDAEIERLRAEVARLTEKVASMDVVGLAYAQRELPGPFGDADTIGSPAAWLRDFGA